MASTETIEITVPLDRLRLSQSEFDVIRDLHEQGTVVISRPTMATLNDLFSLGLVEFNGRTGTQFGVASLTRLGDALVDVLASRDWNR